MGPSKDRCIEDVSAKRLRRSRGKWESSNKLPKIAREKRTFKKKKKK